MGDARKGKIYGAAVWPLSRFVGDFARAAESGELDDELFSALGI